ncbi:hypothetical protein DJ030_02995 [bacterium endosymbiont of Escarpia laminata]|nr:MAG: hypothetical protein DJ030_02995 [bacterium endosymbiont of Escarpia laminata]
MAIKRTPVDLFSFSKSYMTSFLAFENIPKAFLENMAIDDMLSHFQSSNTNTASVISIPLLLVKSAPLIREFNLRFFHVSAKRLSMSCFESVITMLIKGGKLIVVVPCFDWAFGWFVVCL